MLKAVSNVHATLRQSQLCLLAEMAHPAPRPFAALIMLLRLALRQVHHPVAPAQLQVFQQEVTFLRAADQLYGFWPLSTGDRRL